MNKVSVVLFCIASSLYSLASAQSTDDGKYAGIGARVRPAYEGANSSRVDAIPYLRSQGDAADSPLTQDRNNWYANAGIAYRF